jgi:uncharacterized protein involved in exopolysaccharide biosynthesis
VVASHDEAGRQLRRLLRWWWLPPACALLAALTAYAIASNRQTEYSAAASLLFRDTAVDDRLFPGASSRPPPTPNVRRPRT